LHASYSKSGLNPIKISHPWSSRAQKTPDHSKEDKSRSAAKVTKEAMYLSLPVTKKSNRENGKNLIENGQLKCFSLCIGQVQTVPSPKGISNGQWDW
jgi:hypothetical protein